MGVNKCKNISSINKFVQITRARPKDFSKLHLKSILNEFYI